MATYNSDTDFIGSLNTEQREYYLNRVAEQQHQLQDLLHGLSRSLSMVSAWNSDSLALLSASSSKSRRILTAHGIEYRYATVPGCARIQVSFRDGRPMALWDGSQKDPWTFQLEGFDAFKQSGHAETLHRQLLEIDRGRRTRRRRRQ